MDEQMNGWNLDILVYLMTFYLMVLALEVLIG